MFDIGWSELLVIGVVALVVIGPKELPGVLRSLGQWLTKIRRMASEFQNQFQDAMREAELSDMKKQFDDLTTAKDYGLNLDPIGQVKSEIESAMNAADAPAVKPAEPAGTPATDAITAPSGTPATDALTASFPSSDTPVEPAPVISAPVISAPVSPAPDKQPS
jgi:sec-independent protein translocase protein TatB